MEFYFLYLYALLKNSNKIDGNGESTSSKSCLVRLLREMYERAMRSFHLASNMVLNDPLSLCVARHFT